MNGILQDVRFAFRHLWQRPLWSGMIIAVLALGIGANTAMFSGYDAWVLRPLDFRAPEQLVAVRESQPALGRSAGVSPRNLGDWMEQQQSFEEVGAFSRERFNLSDESAPVRLDGTRVSASLFPMLGKRPVRGRGFRPEEDRPGQPAAVALISYRLWERRFGVDPQVVGRTVRLDGRTHEIVGVMEPGFLYPEWADVWTPMGLDVGAGDRDNRWLNVVARLRSDTSVESAGTQMSTIAARLEQQYPDSNSGWNVDVVPLRGDLVPPVITTALAASLASGILVLLVLCANVASLILAQATARRRATAIRAALGASRWRLVRQSLAEGVLLALPAGALGALFAVLGVRWTLSWVPVDPPYLFAMSGLNATGGVYTLLVSLLAGVACGLVPLLRSSGVSVLGALKSGGGTSGRRGGTRFGSTLVIGELALSTTLLIGALLVVKSFLALQGADRGYRTDSVLTAELDLVGEGVDQESQRLAAVDRILAGLRELDGADGVGLTTHLPAGGGHRVWGLVAEDRTYAPGEAINATVHGITGDYLTALDIPVLEGRTLTDSEKREGGAVALVSQRLATRLWGDENPLGRELRRRRGALDDDGWLRVVGIVGDVDYGRDLVNVGTVPDAQLYVPYADLPSARLVIALSSDRPPAGLAGAARQALATAVPGIPVDVVDLETALFREQWMSRYFSNQLAIYALMATAIAALGLYGLISHSAGGRRQELAVRLALGARRVDLIRLILRDASLLAGVGISIGLGVALGVTGFAATMLYEVSARDPVVFGGVAILLTAVTLVAAFLPARRASRLNPNSALRAE